MLRLTRIKRAVKRSPTLRNLYFRAASLHHRARLRGAWLRGTLKGGEQPRSVNPENMIWIFCTARSGSTWLKSMLNDLVEGEVWEEPKVGRLFGEFYSRYARQKPNQLGRVNYVLGDPTREAWTKALRNFVLQTAWASHPSITPERYLIVKEPGGAIGAPLLMDALPESRMVLLVRDPRDFAASVLDAVKKGEWMYEGLDEWARRDLSSERAVLRYLKVLSKQYVRQMSNGKKAFDSHGGRKIVLKYDDLREDTLGTMRQLCAALAIPVDEQRLSRAVVRHSWEKVPEKEKGAGKFYRKATSGGWQEDLTPEQARIVEDITAPLIEEFSFGAMGKARARRLARDRREKIVAAQRRATEGPLPDFVVLGTQKGGTSFFYRLVTEHPLVRGAAAKELHFFDNKFAEGVGWYRRCFSEGERVDGKRTITGEASPSYLFDQQVPERIARIVPEARLIALLRNPVDRAYSHYQMEVWRGKEARSFEEATQEEMSSAEGEGNTVDVPHAYLRRGLYAEQLERFSFFANRERLLVVKSENLFTRRLEVLERVLRFLRLPPFESTLAPPTGRATYEPMDPGTRRRLEAFFAPHNERLYDLLSTDFGW